MKPPPRLSRRAALQGLGAGLGLASVGCGAAASENGEGAASSEVTAAAPTPAQLLAGIDHIVVLMMENRSFDHYLGALGEDGAYAARAEVDGLDGGETNPAPDGTAVASFRMDNFTPEDPPHSWEEAHAQWNGGQNDGFVKAHAGAHQHEVMGYHDRSQLPLYYWLADNFTVCDRWFSSVMGPTWPNRFYVHAATSKGKKNNRPLWSPPRTIWDALDDANVAAKNYTAGIATFFVGGFPTKVFSGNPSAGIRDFFDAARNGTLPAYSLIDPDWRASDDHPSHNIQRGQAFVASIYAALAASPQWSRTLLVITYDEHGGFYDHVSPPTTQDDVPEFRQLGFRVPAFVIGPRVRKGAVVHTQLEHVSALATLRTRFGIPDLNARMAATNDVSSCIDPAKLTAPSPPPPGMPTVAMTRSDALRSGVGTSSQPLLDEMVAAGIVPGVDQREDEDRIAEWLEEAIRLGAVRIVG